MDLPVAWAMIFSKEGNGDIWLGGYGNDQPQIGAGTPLREGSNITIPCTNLNQISLLPSQDGDEVYVTAGLTGDDIDFTPSNPPSLDLVPPTVVSTSPTGGATNQETNVLISVQMSEAMLDNTVNNTNVTVSPSFTYTADLDSSDPTKIVVLHNFNLANSTTYTITLKTGLKDLAGNSLASQQTFSFTTKATAPPPDTTAPTLVTAWPSNNAIITVNDTPYLTFSEAMSLSTFASNNTYIAKDSNGQLVSPVSYSQSADQKTVYLNTSALQGSTIYDFILSPSLFPSGPTDLAGNRTTSSMTRVFTTKSTTTTQTIYNVAGDTWFNIGSAMTHYEIKETGVSNSSIFIGFKPTRYTFKMKKIGSPTGNITLKIINNGGGSSFTLKKTIGTYPASSLSTSESSIVFDDASNTYSLVLYDQIAVNYNSGSSSNYISLKYTNSDVADGSRTIMSRTNNSDNNADYPGGDLAMVLEGYY